MLFEKSVALAVQALSGSCQAFDCLLFLVDLLSPVWRAPLEFVSIADNFPGVRRNPVLVFMEPRGVYLPLRFDERLSACAVSREVDSIVARMPLWFVDANTCNTSWVIIPKLNRRC